MKQIRAFIDPKRLDELRRHLETSGVRALTLHHGHSVGRKPERRETYRGSTYVIDQVSELEIVIVIPDERLSTVIATIEAHGGDGDILVSPIDQIVRVSKRGTPEAIPRAATRGAA